MRPPPPPLQRLPQALRAPQPLLPEAAGIGYRGEGKPNAMHWAMHYATMQLRTYAAAVLHAALPEEDEELQGGLAAASSATPSSPEGPAAAAA